MFDHNRNANPVFHLMEALWMMAGRNDLAFVKQFNQQMAAYSDNGITLRGAYGYRWRKHFGYDQVQQAVEILTRDPNSRQVVLSMWDAYQDLGAATVDTPCNLQVLLRIVNGMLVMTTTNRSNDLIWGLLGANAVHLSILHEYIAIRLGVPMGPWYHMSNNLHVYQHHWPLLELVESRPSWEYLPYPEYVPLMDAHNWHGFEQDCADLCDGKTDDFCTPFFDDVVAPMVQSWYLWKNTRVRDAIRMADCIAAEDWGDATSKWYRRRLHAQENTGS